MRTAKNIRTDKIFAYKIRGVAKRSIAASKFRIRPLPLDNELLSSWLVRTSYLHHSDPATFLNLYLPEYDYKLWDNDIDLYCDDILASKLSDKTGFPKDKIYGMTLKSYESYLSENIYPNNRNKFIIPIHRRQRNVRQFAQRLCPLCLKEDKEPYLRKKWRLFFSTACVKHNCFLIDKCPDCGTPFMVNKRLNDEDFPHCRKCGFSFKEAEPEFIDENSYGLKAIKTLYDVLDNGIFMFENQPVYSFFFFDVLNHFTKLIKYGYRKGLLLEEEDLDEEGLPISNIRGIPYIMELDIRQQYVLFSALMEIFENQENIIIFCKENKITVKMLSRSMGYIPFWFAKTYDGINKSKYYYTSEEIKNGLIYLQTHGIKPSLKNLLKTFRMGVAKRKR